MAWSSASAAHQIFSCRCQWWQIISFRAHKRFGRWLRNTYANRARLQALTPPQTPQGDLHYAPATRTAAAALANERLDSDLRSPTYAARISTGGGSTFARRIAGAGTQAARDELAKTRAHAVRVAQMSPERRAPITPPRRRNAASQRKDGLAPRPDPVRPATGGQGATARPARVRSSTIALLRQRQQQGGDPIPPDTSRPVRRGEHDLSAGPPDDTVEKG
jgi:hypothetical protein